MFIFIRHGESTGEGSNPPLTDHGRAMAREAGQWLRERGYRPTRLVATSKRRTQETAEIIANQDWGDLGAPKVESRSGSVRTPAEWETIAAVMREGGAFVGHHPTQGLLVRHAGAPVAPKDNRCVVYVIERTEAGWRCVAHWEGRPKQR